MYKIKKYETAVVDLESEVNSFCQSNGYEVVSMCAPNGYSVIVVYKKVQNEDKSKRNN